MVGRPRWFISGVLLLGAGVLTLISTSRHWARCRPDTHSASCVRLEEVTTGVPSWAPVAFRDPEAALLTAVAGLMLCLAWVLVAGWARRRWMRTLVTVIVALQPLSGAALGLGNLFGHDRLLSLASSGWLTWPAEMLVMPLLLGAGWIMEESPLQMTRLIVLGWGVTSFGSMHAFGDYIIFMIRHPIAPGQFGNPAGMGFGVAGTQLGVGLIVLIMSLAMGRGPKREDGRRGRDGFMLAA